MRFIQKSRNIIYNISSNSEFFFGEEIFNVRRSLKDSVEGQYPTHSLYSFVRENHEFLYSDTTNSSIFFKTLGFHSIFQKILKERYCGYSLGNIYSSVGECVKNKLTYGVPLFIYLSYGKKKIRLYVGKVPIPTQQGYFVVFGIKKSFVNQFIRNPGLYQLKENYSSKKKFLDKGLRFIHWDGNSYEFLMLKSIDTFHRMDICNAFVKLQGKKLNSKNIVSFFNLLIFLGALKSDLFSLISSREYYKRAKFSSKHWLYRNLYKVDSSYNSLVFFKKLKNIESIYNSQSLLSRISDLCLYHEGSISLDVNFDFLNKVDFFYTVSRKSIQNDLFSREVYEILQSKEVDFLQNELNDILFKKDLNLFFDIDLPKWSRKRLNMDLNLFRSSNRLGKCELLKIFSFLRSKWSDDIYYLSDDRDIVNRVVRSYYDIAMHRFNKLLRENQSIKNTFYPDKNSFSNGLSHILYNLHSFSKFLSISDLSQYLEEINPLSSLTHLRRITLLGPGGLSQNNIPMESRDIHYSYYNKLCPIESPEGKSIGIVNSPSVHCRLNIDGCIESPYRKVHLGYILNTVHYLSFDYFYKIACEHVSCTKDGSILSRQVLCRYRGNFVYIDQKEIDYIDLTIGQFVSISSSLIPFLEHNDGNRALMGSNMQRQSIPLLKQESPLIGTGFERVVGRDFNGEYKSPFSGISLGQFHSLFVLFRHSSFSHIRNLDSMFHLDFLLNNIYLCSFSRRERTNQKTSIFHRNLSYFGEIFISKESLLSSSSFSSSKELSLGQNLLIAFNSYNGYNFEDSIVVSSTLLEKGFFSNDYITEYSDSLDYRLISKCSFSSQIDNLDTDFLPQVGSKVLPGNTVLRILKGKKEIRKHTYQSLDAGFILDVIRWSPTAKYSIVESQREGHLNSSFKSYYLMYVYLILGIYYNLNRKKLSPYYSRLYLSELLSLYTANLFTLDGLDLFKIVFIYFLRKTLFMRFNTFKSNKKNAFLYLLEDKKQFLRNCLSLKKKKKNSYQFNRKHFLSYFLRDNWQIGRYSSIFCSLSLIDFNELHRSKLTGDVLLDFFKIYSTDFKKKNLNYVNILVQTRKDIEVGDKLTGRYGNKGVVSKISVSEDMPYMKNGVPIDIILNPLGVSSRMNIGQLFEAHLGFVSFFLGKKIQLLLGIYQGESYLYLLRKYFSNIYKYRREKSIVQNLSSTRLIHLSKRLFSGIPIEVLPFSNPSDLVLDFFAYENGFSRNTQNRLIDPKVGDTLDNSSTVGYLYLLKLNHQVESKLHGRATGSYSALTQQPLKGKSNEGGQRLGEMEIWALQSYGVAYTLQEMIGLKSDSLLSRERIGDPFLKGFHHILYSSENVPESYYLLMTELRSLGIDFGFVH